MDPYSARTLGPPLTPALLRLDPMFDPFPERSALPKALRRETKVNSRASGARVGGSEPDWHSGPPRRTRATPKAFEGMTKS